MALTWTPTNATPLFDHSESDVNISHTIVVASDLGIDLAEITGFSVTPDTLPDQVEITIDGDTLEVAAPDLDGMFPILSIKHLRNGAIEEVLDFDDVPDEADEILEYRKEPNSPKIYILSVTATDVATTETKDYEMIVRGNYTPGRNRLVLEVLERS